MATQLLPNIVTPRTVVRLGTLKDRDTILAFYTDNRERLTPLHPTWPEGFFTPQFWEAQIARNEEEYYCDLSARMFIFDRAHSEPRCIGNVSLGAIIRNAAQFSFLGYSVDAAYEGKGYMTEAIGATVKFGFEEMNLHRIAANYMPTNEKSGKLLRRLGFTVEGYARDYLCLNGVWQDHIMTAIRNPDWKPARL